jgi:twitching motility protein PilJ
MAALDAIRKIFIREGKGFVPFNLARLTQKIRAPGTDDETIPQPLPFIGALPYARQMAILLTALIICGVIFVAVLSGVYVFSSHNAGLRSTATEMQVLSQRIASASAAGMQGNAEAFAALEAATARFNANMQAMRNESSAWLNQGSEKSENLERIEQVWRDNFQPSKDRPNVLNILANRDSLIGVARNVATATRNDRRLSLTIGMFTHVAPYLEENSQSTVSQGEQLGQINLRLIKNAGLLLTGDTSSRAIFELMG